MLSSPVLIVPRYIKDPIHFLSSPLHFPPTNKVSNFLSSLHLFSYVCGYPLPYMSFISISHPHFFPISHSASQKIMSYPLMKIVLISIAISALICQVLGNPCGENSALKPYCCEKYSGPYPRGYVGQDCTVTEHCAIPSHTLCCQQLDSATHTAYYCGEPYWLFWLEAELSVFNLLVQLYSSIKSEFALSTHANSPSFPEVEARKRIRQFVQILSDAQASATQRSGYIQYLLTNKKIESGDITLRSNRWNIRLDLSRSLQQGYYTTYNAQSVRSG